MTTIAELLSPIEKRLAAATLIRPVPIYDGYYADRNGSIWSCNSRWGGMRRLTPFTDTYGYLKLKAMRDGKLFKTAVHKMVCLAFHGLPDAGQEVRHLDGTRVNNSPDNLRWGTRSENALDRKSHGTERAAENGRNSAHKRVHIKKLFCCLGHARVPENLYGGRSCKICTDNRTRARRKRLRGEK